MATKWRTVPHRIHGYGEVSKGEKWLAWCPRYPVKRFARNEIKGNGLEHSIQKAINKIKSY